MSGRSQLFKIDVMRRAIASGTAKPKWSPVLVHSSRTAIAAVASVLVARLFRLPETYWAAITTLVITQSSLGTAVAVSGERFMGTVLGATVGAVAASEFEPGMLVFGAGVFILGILSAALHSDRRAYRLAGVTLTIVLLVPRTGPASHASLSMDVGVDTHDFRPWHFDEIRNRMKERATSTPG